MDAKTGHTRTACLAIAGLIWLASAGAVFAQGRDATDRKLEMEMSRERAESRIERLHENGAGARAQEKKKNKKSRNAPKRQRLLQY